MKNNLNRRKFLSLGALTMSGLTMGVGSALPLETLARPGLPGILKEEDIPKLTSLPPSELFSVLNLELPELASVKKVLERKGTDAALKELLSYYRNRYPKSPELSQADQSDAKTSIQRANDIEHHIFQWGPYPSADYGLDINWAADPAVPWFVAHETNIHFILAYSLRLRFRSLCFSYFSVLNQKLQLLIRLFILF